MLKDEDILLESFVQVFGMAGKYISKFSAIPRSN
jgi:hypothetical protein